MEPIPKLNGKDTDHDTPHAPPRETEGVGHKGANIDMPARENPSVGEYRSEMMRATLAMEAAAKNMEARRGGLERWAPWATVLLVVMGWAGSGLLTAKNSESDLKVQIAVLAEQLKEWKEQSIRASTEQARIYDRDNKVNEERWNEVKIVLRARGIKVPN